MYVEGNSNKEMYFEPNGVVTS